MNFLPAAMVSRIPQAVAAGRALILSINFFEMTYSFLNKSKDELHTWDVQIAVR